MNTGFNLELLSAELDLDMYEFDFSSFKPIEISRDFEKEPDIKISTQLYLKYKNKIIPVTDNEEKILDEAISKYAKKKVFYMVL